MALIADDEEIKCCMDLIVRISTGTGLMHEAFDVDDVNTLLAGLPVGRTAAIGRH